jgi:acyl-CoA synthetase (AMP-forming)/AMP-acid ligase II/thioesterase domain-containing protein/acyl carrier protein
MFSEMEVPFGLERRAHETPLAAALEAPHRASLTYSSLLNHVKATSDKFREAGILPGAVIALALPNGPEFVTGMLAITTRWACIPFDLSLTRDECRQSLPRIRASALVCEDGASTPMVDVARELRMRVIRIRRSRDSHAGIFELAGTEGPRDQPQARQIDAALLFHTSSTSGVPKLVPRSRASMQLAATQDAEALELNATDRFLSLMPLCYGHGISAIFTQLVRGGSAFCPAAFEADRFLAWLEEFRPTWFSADPTLQRAILALAQEQPEAFRRIPLRFIRSAGAPPGPDVVRSLEQLLGVPVLDGYGLTEMPSVTRNTPSQRKPGSVGRSRGAEVAILDDSGKFLPVGVEGEVVLRGPTLMPGYLDNPEANLEAFRNGWFRTGDVGRLDEDGFLFIIGRQKEMIARGGKKIVPQEVDHALAKHPSLAEAAAFAIPHRTLGEDVAAAVVLRPGVQAAELEIRRFAAERLAAYKVPRRVFFVDSIPRTRTGKPKRGVLAEQFLDLARQRMGSYGSLEQPARPPTNVESRLIDIWRNVLGVEQIGIHDDFFDLGGDSLSAAIMLTQISEHMGIVRSRLTEGEFWDQPAIATLARIISDGSREHEPSAVVPNQIIVLRRDGRHIPFFCFPATELQAYEFRHLSQELGPEQPFFAVCPPPAMQRSRLLKMDELALQSAASIRSVRPHGPYILGGCCRSAVFAFETARQLIAEGEEVALLAIFEAPAPGYPKIARHWRGYARGIIHVLRLLSKGGVRSAVRDIAAHIRKTSQIKTRRIRAKANRAMASVAFRDAPDEARWSAVVRREFIPSVLRVPIVHFLAAEVPVSTRILSDPRFGWEEYTERDFKVSRIPADALSMFTAANAPVLAAELKQAFASAEAAIHMEVVESAPAASTAAGSS